MKICPRCSYVDTEGRRVCLACRGSLMGVEAVDKDALVASVAAASGEASPTRGHVPWGPGLRALLDEGEPETGDAGADADPRPIAAPGAAGAVGAVTGAPDAAASVSSAPPPAVIADATATREKLARMYDARTAAPVVVEEAARAGAAPDLATPRPRTRATPRRRGVASSDAAPAPRRASGRRRVVAVIVAVVLGFAGLRAVRHALDGGDAALVRDPTTAVDRLPWRTEPYGDLTVSVPTDAVASAVDAASGYTRFDRYVLPDITLTITARAAIPGLSTDAALRTYASQVAALGGGGVATGFARDLTFGTAFSATLQVPEGTGYLYVVSTPGSVVEIRADAASVESGRPTRIFEQVIRSVTPR